MGIKSYETLHKRIINNSFATPVNTMGSAVLRIFVVHFSQIFQQLIINSFLQSFDTQNTIFAHPKAIFRNLFIKQNTVGMSDTTLRLIPMRTHHYASLRTKLLFITRIEPVL